MAAILSRGNELKGSYKGDVPDILFAVTDAVYWMSHHTTWHEKQL